MQKQKNQSLQKKNRIYIEEIIMQKKKLRESQASQKIEKDIEIKKILSSSISKFSRFSVFDENCV